MFDLYVKTKCGLKKFIDVVCQDGSSDEPILRNAVGEILIFNAKGELIGITQTNGAAIWIKIREPKQFVLYSYLTEEGWRYARQVQHSLAALANER